MFCINCGNKLPDGALFCDQCGRRIVYESTYNPAPQPVQPQYPTYYGMQKNPVPVNYEERQAKRVACNFVIFRTFVYMFMILYTIATKCELFYSSLHRRSPATALLFF